jgi:hypothetical protein
MDPNAALTTLRELATEQLDGNISDQERHADQLAEAAIALDEWLTKGGFLPAAWAVGRDDAKAESDNETRLVEVVRAAIAEARPSLPADPVAVLIDTTEWDNGWFYSDYMTLVFADDSRAPLDVDAADVLADMTHAHGPIGAQACMVIDLATGDIDCDDYGLEHMQLPGVTYTETHGAADETAANG